MAECQICQRDRLFAGVENHCRGDIVYCHHPFLGRSGRFDGADVAVAHFHRVRGGCRHHTPGSLTGDSSHGSDFFGGQFIGFHGWRGYGICDWRLGQYLLIHVVGIWVFDSVLCCFDYCIGVDDNVAYPADG